MDTLFGLLFFFFFFFFSSSFFTYTVLCADICPPSSCSFTGPTVRFPFRLNDWLPDRCGYPAAGFDLSCNSKSQTLVNLPSSGYFFIVTRIDYASQSIYIKPDFCRPNRLLSFSLWGSPFKGAYLRNYAIFNCSSPWSYTMYPAEPIPCLSHDNYTIVAMPSFPFAVEMPSTCRNISMVSVPVQQFYNYGSSLMDLSEELQLIWDEPNCSSCEARGGTCGFKNDGDLAIGCSNLPTLGLSRSVKYGIIIGVGIPGLVCIIGLACYICSRIKAYGRRPHLNTELATTTITPVVFIRGLDGPTIESYPKTVLGESRRLPKSNDGTCPICLAEYQPKETLRTIPECNHYFHASCIDEWLRLNATCPLCRNSPESSVMTPSSSMSSSASSVPSPS